MSAIEKLLNTVKEKGGVNGTTEKPDTYQYTPNNQIRNDDNVTVPAFPLQVYPKRIQQIISDCHNMLSYPVDFTAASILAATAVAIGRTHKALLFPGQWEETSCLYMALVAPPGTAKSHPLKFALDPVIRRNKEAIKKYNQAQKALADQGIASGDLVDRQCLFSDFTIEALVKAIQKNPRGISVYLDELRAWFQNFNRYNSGSEQEFWLQNWSGTPLAVTRLTRKAFLEWPSISVVGTIQPSLLEEIGKGGRGENGFVERMLFVYPEKVDVIFLKRRYERSDTSSIIARNYIAIMNTLLDRAMLIEGGMEEDDRAYELFFSNDADNMIIDFINELKKQMDAIDNENMRNIYSKMQTYVVRFALLINRLEWACEQQDNRDFPAADTLTITGDQVTKACILAEYFLNHAKKANAIINGQSPVEKLPRDIKNWYRSLPLQTAISTNDAEAAGAKASISRATIFRLLNEHDASRKLFQKIRHGYYERLYV